MRALISTPATRPRFQFPQKAARPLANASLTKTILRWHSILTSTEVTPDEAIAAKHRMLGALEEATKSPFPLMTVAPISLLPECGADNVFVPEATKETAVLGTCERPITPAMRSPLMNPEHVVPLRSLPAEHSETQRGPRLRKRALITPRCSEDRSSRDVAASNTKPAIAVPCAPKIAPIRGLDRWENEGGRWLNHKPEPGPYL